MKLKHFKKIKKNKPTLKTVSTWLPVFTGYYNSIFDASEMVMDSELNLSEAEFKEYYSELYEAGVTHDFFNYNAWEFADFTECFNDASESIAGALVDLDHAGIIDSVKYESTVSPKYYNFSTDSINCEIKFNVKKLEKYLENNLSEFTNYISERYTSRSSFSSHYSNDVNDWLNMDDLCAHSAGSILQFVIYNEYGSESEAEYALYEESSVYECFYNIKWDFKGLIEKFKEEA